MVLWGHERLKNSTVKYGLSKGLRPQNKRPKSPKPNTNHTPQSLGILSLVSMMKSPSLQKSTRQPEYQLDLAAKKYKVKIREVQQFSAMEAK